VDEFVGVCVCLPLLCSLSVCVCVSRFVVLSVCVCVCVSPFVVLSVCVCVCVSPLCSLSVCVCVCLPCALCLFPRHLSLNKMANSMTRKSRMFTRKRSPNQTDEHTSVQKSRFVNLCARVHIFLYICFFRKIHQFQRN